MDAERRDDAFYLRWVLPVVVLQLVLVAGLMTGQETLYLRDVLKTHLVGVGSTAVDWTSVGPSVLDLTRAGGQPAAGNPNLLPFYPTTVLYRVLDPLWVLNAHFWLHFLALPWAFYWLARVWGLSREAAWAGAVFYTFSGFALSQLSYYNLIPIAVWAPCAVASWLRLRRGPFDRITVVSAALALILLLVSGDPIMIAWALVATGLALVCDGAGQPGIQRAGVRLSLVAGAGALIAAPQWVEFARVVPTSYRGVLGYSAANSVGRFHPYQLIDWFLPTFFGRIDQIGPAQFWGHDFFGGALPLFLSLAPGLLVLLLWWVGPGGGPATRWALSCGLLGLVASTGVLAHIMDWVSPGRLGALTRFPVKSWLLVAIGGSLLAGAAVQRLQRGAPEAWRRARWGFGALAFVLLALWLMMASEGGGEFFASRLGVGAAFELETSRWLRILQGQLLLLGFWILLVLFLRRRLDRSVPILLVVFGVGQWWQLRSVVDTVSVAAVRQVAPVPEWPAVGTRLVHAATVDWTDWQDQDTPAVTRSEVAREGAAQLVLRAARERAPFAFAVNSVHATRWRWELNPTPEGLDAYLTYLARDATRKLPAEARVRLLAAWGIEAVLARPGLEVRGLHPEWLDSEEQIAGYRVLAAQPEIRLVEGVRYAASPLDAVGFLADDSFDASGEVVLAGGGETRRPGRARFSVRRIDGQEILVDTEGEGAATLVVQRTFQSVYRATVDGAPAPVLVADLHRLGVAVPAGRHEVRLWVEEGPRYWSLVLSLIGLSVLLALVRSRPRSAMV